MLHAQANSEKLRLEKKQRAARQAADRGDPIRPRWFKANPNKQDVDDLAFVYNGGYFEARRRGDYEVRPCTCPGGKGGGSRVALVGVVMGTRARQLKGLVGACSSLPQ